MRETNLINSHKLENLETCMSGHLKCNYGTGTPKEEEEEEEDTNWAQLITLSTIHCFNFNPNQLL